jgi:acyl carrier protein
MSNLEHQILDIVKEMKLGKNHEITIQSNLKDDLGLDSLSFTELLIELEEHFEIEIDLDDPELPKLTILEDIKNIIDKLITSK